MTVPARGPSALPERAPHPHSPVHRAGNYTRVPVAPTMASLGTDVVTGEEVGPNTCLPACLPAHHSIHTSACTPQLHTPHAHCAPAYSAVLPGTGPAPAEAFGLPEGTAVNAAPLVAPITTGGCPAKCGKQQ